MDIHWIGWPKLLLFCLFIIWIGGIFFLMRFANRIIAERVVEDKRDTVLKSLRLMYFTLIWLVFDNAIKMGLFTFRGSIGTYVNIAAGVTFVWLALHSLNRLHKMINGVDYKSEKKKWYEKRSIKKKWYER